jgi:hypothetical protein
MCARGGKRHRDSNHYAMLSMLRSPERVALAPNVFKSGQDPWYTCTKFFSRPLGGPLESVRAHFSLELCLHSLLAGF